MNWYNDTLQISKSVTSISYTAHILVILVYGVCPYLSLQTIQNILNPINKVCYKVKKAPFSIATATEVLGRGATPFPGFLHFTLDTYLMLLSVKQEGIKYHFKNLWYDATWD